MSLLTQLCPRPEPTVLLMKIMKANNHSFQNGAHTQYTCICVQVLVVGFLLCSLHHLRVMLTIIRQLQTLTHARYFVEATVFN